ncbi:MAG: Na/Pi cotransporter family protein [Lachnospiraceae bacterium]|nr:Na/Pi cotransporter family protein [Lachnospiraceae bacterium]
MSAIELFTLVAGLIGGLAMFLYGMNVMSGGLTKASGGKLESTLAHITSNKLLAYFFGVGVTALVQSSSASTVMVVGLVNSGIMSLKQAVNVILGANLGTTFTAWLLSLNAISSDNFIINLFKPMSFTPFLALIGIGLYMFTKSDKKKNVGTILLGFAVLMFGMDMMSDAVAPLKTSAEFQSFLTMFQNPIFGLLIGILFTMVIQSSAGTIGVVQALSSSIFISYSMAIPVVIGAEVGTCITAILSSLGANKNGKRTALMHLYFNIIKASTFMIVFYALNAVLHFGFMEEAAGMVGIASIHTLVNLIGTPLMLPFSGVLVSLALKTIPIDEKERQEQEDAEVLTTLDTRFLSNPPFALELSRRAAADMAESARDSLFMAMELIENYDQEKADEIDRLEKKIDRYEDQLGTYLVKLSSVQMTRNDSHTLSILLHCISDFERISDHALNIMQTVREMHEADRHFSAKAAEEVRVFTAAVTEIVSTSVTVFETLDLTLAKSIEPLEEVIDGLHMEVKRRHVRRLRKGKCTIELGFDLSDIGTDYERIADHCSNVAVCILQVSEDGFDTHGYLEMVREEKNADFEKSVDFYERKYRLPISKHDDDEAMNASFVEAHPVLVNVMAMEDAHDMAMLSQDQSVDGIPSRVAAQELPENAPQVASGVAADGVSDAEMQEILKKLAEKDRKKAEKKDKKEKKDSKEKKDRKDKKKDKKK